MAKAKEIVKAEDKALGVAETSVEKSSTQNKKSFFKKVLITLKTLFILSILLGLLLVVAKSPEIKEYYKEILTGEEKREIKRINAELAEAQQQLEILSVENGQLLALHNDVKVMSEMLKKLDESNSDMVRSKADVSLVLGAINRIDNIDTRVSEVAKVSDRGALIAMSAMLIKDASERGVDFTYEMTILEQLTKDEPKVKPYVDILSSYSSEGIYSEVFLFSEFEKIYKMTLSEENASDIGGDDWLSKFNKRFGKIITVRYRKAAEAEEVAELSLDRVFYLMKSGEFERAVAELNLDRYLGLVKDNKDLRDWLQYANARIEFTSALSKVSSYSLAIMKVNELKR